MVLRDYVVEMRFLIYPEVCFTYGLGSAYMFEERRVTLVL
jgi:hypothetical protein